MNDKSVLDEEDFQQSNYFNFQVTKEIAFGRGKEWRLAIPAYLVKRGFNLRDQVVADMGCGIGYFGAFLIRNHFVKHVDFFDIAPSLKSKISDVFRLTETREAYSYQCADIIKSHIPCESYDFVFCMGSLHHAYNLKLYLDSVYSALRPGGFLVANEPSYAETINDRDLAAEYQRRLGFIASNTPQQVYPRHDFFYRVSEFICVARIAGFEIHSIQPWDRTNGYSLLSPLRKLKSSFLKAKGVTYSLANFLTTASSRSALDVKPSENLFILRKPLQPQEWRPHLDLLGIK